MRRNRKRNRKLGFDYATPGAYFVTACVKNRIKCLGKIENKQMILNSYGEIVKTQWLWLGTQYPYVKLDEWVVMPDHFHGILIINNIAIDVPAPVGVGRDLPLRGRGQPTKIKPVSELMGAFKTTSSKLIHRSGFNEFAWQRSFHDHIIRDDFSFYRIREYIKKNPEKN